MFKLFERYKVLALFVSLTVVGLLLHLIFANDSSWLKLWGALDVSFAVALGVIALCYSKREKR